MPRGWSPRGDPNNQVSSEALRKIIDKLRLERVSQRGISRITGVSLQWLSSYLKKQSEAIPLELPLLPKTGKIAVAGSERWTFVPKNSPVQGLWEATDRLPQRMVGFFLGSHDFPAARA